MITWWLFIYKPQIKCDKHQQYLLSKNTKQLYFILQNLNLESLILKNQILPIHSYQFFSSLRNFLIYLWRSQHFLSPQRFTFCADSVNTLTLSLRGTGSCWPCSPLYAQSSSYLRGSNAEWMTLNKCLCLKGKDQFLSFFYSLSAQNIRCWETRKYHRLPVFCY